MSLDEFWYPVRMARVPRASGDEPLTTRYALIGIECSPRERG